MRNRCVEISLLETPPPVTVSPPSLAADNAPLQAATEHTSDLLALVRDGGLADPAEAAAAVAMHSSLVASGGRSSAAGGQGPGPRSLVLWAELAAAVKGRCFLGGSLYNASCVGGGLRSTCALAYPGRYPGAASAANFAAGDVVLSAFADSCGDVGVESEVGAMLVQAPWRDVLENGAYSQVLQDLQVVRVVSGAVSGLGGAAEALLSAVVGAVRGPGAEQHPALVDLGVVPDDEDFVWLSSDVGNKERAMSLLTQAALLVARGAGVSDRHLRVAAAGAFSSPQRPLRDPTAVVGEAVDKMISSLFDCSAWTDIAAMLADMEIQRCPGGFEPSSDSLQIAGSLAESVAAATSRWGPTDPRVNPDLFRSLSKAFGALPMWRPFTLLLDLFDVAVAWRLPLVLKEGAEIEEVRSRIATGRLSEAGVGWLGLSCLICEGDYEVSKFGARGRARSPETRLARASLAPYILPLFQAVDGLVEGLVCREASERAWSVGAQAATQFLVAVQAVVEARDSVSLGFSSGSSVDHLEPGASGGGGDQLVFEWDRFLVAWRWLNQRIDGLRVVLSSPQFDSLGNVSHAMATLRAVTLRIDAAVLEHAGGAAPARDTLWKYGSRAAAPSSARGALALGKLRRLADEFRVLPSGGVFTGHGAGGDEDSDSKVRLGSLMRHAHPSLCVGVQTRRELLDALCTLHWCSSDEQERPRLASATASGSLLSSDGREVVQAGGANVVGNGVGGGALSGFEERLPSVLDEMVKSCRLRFSEGYRGTRLGVTARDEGLEHDTVESGDRFDDFETEAAEAVTNATLVVVSGDGDGSRAAAGASGGGGGVLEDWATLQLSPLKEHWLAAEECQLLAQLATLVAVSGAEVGVVVQGATSTSVTEAGVTGRTGFSALMRRVARLRSVLLATASLSPAVARPYQTLLWAWDNLGNSAEFGVLISRLLPIALESWGRRLWESLVGTPGALSWQLSPPPMVAQACSESGHHGAGGVGSTVFAGPAQLLTLARSGFLLRLASSASFHGGVVPGVGGDSVDLTLMNASARLGQFRAAVGCLRDLRYDSSDGALKPLVELSWARLLSTLRSFDRLVADKVDGFLAFGEALPTASAVSSSAYADGAVGIADKIEESLRQALGCCPDERLVSQADTLVLPAAGALVAALVAFGPRGEGPTKRVEALAGLGAALLGCLRLQLIQPSSPVDPGLRPALKKELLAERLDGITGELTVRRWSLRLEGRGDLSPQVTRCVTYVLFGSSPQCHSRFSLDVFPTGSFKVFIPWSLSESAICTRQRRCVLFNISRVVYIILFCPLLWW